MRFYFKQILINYIIRTLELNETISLRLSDRFDAWLNGICRNVCLRWGRAQSMTVRQQTNLASLHLNGDNGPESLLEENIPDPLAFDPLEELERQDMAVLLDRALGYLPESTRDGSTLGADFSFPGEWCAWTGLCDIWLVPARTEGNIITPGSVIFAGV